MLRERQSFCWGWGLGMVGREESSYMKVYRWEQPRRWHLLELRCGTYQHLPCLPRNKAEVPGDRQRTSQQRPFPLSLLELFNLISSKRKADFLPHSTCNFKLDF